jgi:hypothetical protein
MLKNVNGNQKPISNQMGQYIPKKQLTKLIINGKLVLKYLFGPIFMKSITGDYRAFLSLFCNSDRLLFSCNTNGDLNSFTA